MTELQKIWLALGGLIAIILVALLSILLRKHGEKDTPSHSIEEQLNKEPQTLTLRVKVIDQNCFVSYVGGAKSPKAVKNFVVVFQDDNEQTHKIAVEEDIYDAFEIGQTGELTLIDGKVSSYILDE